MKNIFKIGVAIITYKRPEYIERGVVQLLKLTPNAELLVVSDSDDDQETFEVCKKYGVNLIYASNGGVVRNKNRALLYFMDKTDCDCIILLEDDVFPVERGWCDLWAESAKIWHHVNFSHPGILNNKKSFLRGAGLPNNPHFAELLTGQCTAVSRESVELAGYLDPRFKGYGHGHVEWTIRHLSMSREKNGSDVGKGKHDFVSIAGGLISVDAATHRDEEEVARNFDILKKSMEEGFSYKNPWVDEVEKSQILSDINEKFHIFEKNRESINVPHISTEGLFEGADGFVLPRASVDSMTLRRDHIVISGWIFDLIETDRKFMLKNKSAEILSESVKVMSSDRPDVLKAFSIKKSPRGVGFSAIFPRDEVSVSDINGMSLYFDIFGCGKFSYEVEIPPSIVA